MQFLFAFLTLTSHADEGSSRTRVPRRAAYEVNEAAVLNRSFVCCFLFFFFFFFRGGCSKGFLCFFIVFLGEFSKEFLWCFDGFQLILKEVSKDFCKVLLFCPRFVGWVS